MIKISHLTSLGKLTAGIAGGMLGGLLLLVAFLWTPACSSTQQTQATTVTAAVEASLDGTPLGTALNSLVGTSPTLAKVKATLYSFATNPNSAAVPNEVAGVAGALAPLAGPTGISDDALITLANTLYQGALPVLAGLTKPSVALTSGTTANIGSDPATAFVWDRRVTA